MKSVNYEKVSSNNWSCENTGNFKRTSRKTP